MKDMSKIVGEKVANQTVKLTGVRNDAIFLF